jgi:hypothetical protein
MEHLEINELRINNLVKCRVPNGFAIYRVSAIDGINSKVLLSKKETGRWVGMDMVFPVPITEKILQEYNFREMDMEDFDFPEDEETGRLYSLLTISVGTLWVGFIYNEYYFFSETGNLISLNGVAPIKGIHSIQNRYYSMFGMELVKPEDSQGSC